MNRYSGAQSLSVFYMRGNLDLHLILQLSPKKRYTNIKIIQSGEHIFTVK
jgi:hypothetical protein